MALRTDNSTNTPNNAGQAQGRKGPAVLGYVNVGIATTVPGEQRRVESIRLMDNNPLHVIIFNGLNLQREGDPSFEVPEGATAKEIAKLEEARKNLLAERLAGFRDKLVLSFNPSRADADSSLVDF